MSHTILLNPLRQVLSVPSRLLSDVESQKYSSQSPRGRSTTDPDLSLRVASSDESITNGAKRTSRIDDNPVNSLRGYRTGRQYMDIRWFPTGSSSIDSKSTGQGDLDGDVYHSRNVLYSNVNEVTRYGQMVKSPSTSHLHYARHTAPHNKPHRYTGTRLPVSHPATNSYPIKSICHSCENGKKNCFGAYLSVIITASMLFARLSEYLCFLKVKSGSVLSLTDDPETPEGLSWRRLHMSRAKLKATATTSELLSGFAMVAMVELQINKPTSVPEWLFVTFAVCTTILVSVHIFALMISTYLLPSIDAVSKLHVSSLVTESPHDRMKGFIELAWAFSTILGLLLFLVEIAILCWVKFWDYSFTAAMSATMIVIPVLVIFVAFAMHFYHSLVVIKCKTSVNNIQELENMKKQLDSVA